MQSQCINLDLANWDALRRPHTNAAPPQVASARLTKGQEVIRQDIRDLHQASEKGWGAAAHMAKAVALTQGWPYERHDQFHQVMNLTRNLTSNDRLRLLHGRADVLHVNFYQL